MLGFASSVMVTWENLAVQLLFPLTDGGTALLFWGMLALITGMSLVYASLAEMASMAPTASGQYHWVSEFAPRSGQKFLSYMVGWLCAIGWQVGVVTLPFMAGTVIQGLIVLNNPDYEFKSWHRALLVTAVSSAAVVFTTFFASKLPTIETGLLYFHLAGFVAFVVTLWTLAPKANAHDVLLTFENHGGWPSTGLASMVGLNSILNALNGYDCAVYMSEETYDASVTLPNVMMASFWIGSLTGLVMILTLIFTMGDVSTIIATPTGYPFIQILYNTTHSLAATNTLTAIVITVLSSGTIAGISSASRQIWSFARDRGLPFSEFLSHVPPGWDVPVRALLVSLGFTIALSCINIGSTVALNAIVSLGVVGIISPYWISIFCVLLKRIRRQPLPPRRWTLGRFGFAVNLGALLFLTPLWFFSFWPVRTPVTAATMNWAVMMYVGIIIVAVTFYVFKARHVYVGPAMLTKRVV